MLPKVFMDRLKQNKTARLLASKCSQIVESIADVGNRHTHMRVTVMYICQLYTCSSNSLFV